MPCFCVMKKKKLNNRRKIRTTPKDIALEKKCNEALEYRIAGYTYDQIAEAMSEDYPDEKMYKQKIAHWIKRAMKNIPKENAKLALKLDLGRLDTMLQPVLEAAQAGDLQAVQSALNIISRRASMIGYDKPKKKEVDMTHKGKYEIVGDILSKK